MIAAKAGSPELYKSISSQLMKVKSGCDRGVSVSLSSEQSQRMSTELASAIDFEIQRINTALDMNPG